MLLHKHQHSADDGDSMHVSAEIAQKTCCTKSTLIRDSAQESLQRALPAQGLQEGPGQWMAHAPRGDSQGEPQAARRIYTAACCACIHGILHWIHDVSHHLLGALYVASYYTTRHCSWYTYCTVPLFAPVLQVHTAAHNMHGMAAYASLPTKVCQDVQLCSRTYVRRKTGKTDLRKSKRLHCPVD